MPLQVSYLVCVISFFASLVLWGHERLRGERKTAGIATILALLSATVMFLIGYYLADPWLMAGGFLAAFLAGWMISLTIILIFFPKKPRDEVKKEGEK